MLTWSISKPSINPKNIFRGYKHLYVSLEENHIIYNLNYHIDSYEINFEDKKENDKGNDDVNFEDIDPIFLLWISWHYKDQNFMNDDFSLKQVVEYSRKDILIENV